MPEISRFFGIIIRMYYDDHPPPHFHAIYGEHEAQIGIDPIVVLQGSLPRRANSFNGNRVGCIASASTHAQLGSVTQ